MNTEGSIEISQTGQIPMQVFLLTVAKAQIINMSIGQGTEPQRIVVPQLKPHKR